MSRKNSVKHLAIFMACLMLSEPVARAAQFVLIAQQNQWFKSTNSVQYNNHSFLMTVFNEDWTGYLGGVKDNARVGEKTIYESEDLAEMGDLEELFEDIFLESNDSFLEENNKKTNAKSHLTQISIEQSASPMPGGPDQPEVQSFSPIDVSDMVDPFTGDFSYNIPLMDVDGYPLNIAYNAGVTMNQEASWVGLGWNLNPGVINRNLRGLPDDYNGTEIVTKEMNMRENWTINGTMKGDLEVFGFGKKKKVANSESNIPSIGKKAPLTLSYNNYNGWSSSVSIGIINADPNNENFFSPSLSISGSSNNGSFINPSLGMRISKNESHNKKLNIGTPWSSRSGMTNTTISYSNTALEKLKVVGSQSFGDASFNFGMSSYTPNITMPTSTFGLQFSFKFGPDAIGTDKGMTMAGGFNRTWLKNSSQDRNAYGYMYHHLGQKNDIAMLDFNRENDGAFTKFTPALPIPIMTYDIFSVSGQGVGGSYRAVHMETPYVFDAENVVNSNNGSLGFELNIGSVAKAGADLSFTNTYSRSGVWNESKNKAISKLGVKNGQFFFREASEFAVYDEESFMQNLGGRNPIYFDLNSHKKLSSLVKSFQGFQNNNPSFTRPNAPKRNQVVSTLNIGQMGINSGAGQNTANAPSVSPLPTDAYAFESLSNPEINLTHHIGEFTVLNTEGTRYVYGLPAYSVVQKDVSFAVEGAQTSFECEQGLKNYSNGDNSINNSKGKGHHFDAVTKPPFAHTYMLTTVLNSDYVDADNIPGPSSGEVGGYLSLNYQKVGVTTNGSSYNPYKWRNPIVQNSAFYEEGMNSYDDDNKAHYMYGEKELWYVNEIRSKNHVAIFYFSNRDDAVSANDENGGLNSSGPHMQKLDKIELYSIPDYDNNGTAAIPIKTVHFVYDYSLCPAYHGNINNSFHSLGSLGSGNNGKLTLKRIYFTYEDSKKGEYTAYNFEYNGLNPSYNTKNIDKWGNYKQPTGTINCNDETTGGKRPWDFPYTTSNQLEADLNASAWNLTDIYLPSGGRINIEYESDDYAFVQNKPVNKMIHLKSSGTVALNLAHSVLSYPGNGNLKAFFIDVSLEPGTVITDYFYTDPAAPNGVKFIYYRALMKMFQDNDYEYVPGYMEVVDYENIGGGTMRIYVKPEKLSRRPAAAYVHPMRLAAINFARMYLPTRIPPSQNASNDLAGFDEGSILNGLIGAFTSFGETFSGGINQYLFNTASVGYGIVWDKSIVRLKEPHNKRYGGGHRVKQVKIFDAWDYMTSLDAEPVFYGQQYSYAKHNGETSGVASYEPQMGGDENVLRQPAKFKGAFGAPNEQNFQTTPYGEQYFPSPSVGYSYVKIANLERKNTQGVKTVNRTATGFVVHEFNTAKEYPTIVMMASDNIEKQKYTIPAYFFNSSVDKLAASQGFVIETNNMHGKPKSQAVYQENKTEPITKIEYYYQDEAYGTSFVLNNVVRSIRRDGTLTNSVVGLNMDVVADFRHSKNTSNTISPEINLNTVPIPPFGVPTLLGSVNRSNQEFRSATIVKVIERFGIQTNTIAYDLGSKVETENLAWDAETGEVLVTRTKTNFEDDIYSFTYPAHWHYDLMGQAYRNVGKSVVFVTPGEQPPSGLGSEVVVRNTPIPFNNGNTGAVNHTIFVTGDEVFVTFLNNQSLKAWVTASSASGITIVNKQGQSISGAVKSIKVLRSGRRNLQTTPIGSIVLRENPIPALGGNVFDQVLQAGAVEYSDDWRTFCECFIDDESSSLYTTNPYVLGLKGTWRPKASYVHLAGRTQTFENENSNIRNDGMFTSFTPFYRLEGGKWVIDRNDWTYTSSVVEFSPFGQALETVDALDRFSSSMYGYNQTLPIAVAANTRYRQLGFDGFEDYAFDNCSDNHFRIAEVNESAIVNTESHTGKHSLKVGAGNTMRFSAYLVAPCDTLQPTFDPFPIQIEPEGDIDEEIIGGTTFGSIAFVFTGPAHPHTIEVDATNPFVVYEFINNKFVIKAPIDNFTDGNIGVTLKVSNENGDFKIFDLKHILNDTK